MLRQELERAVSTVVAAINESGMTRAIHTYIRAGTQSEVPQEAVTQLLVAVQQYAIRAAQFNEVEQQVVRLLELSETGDMSFWAPLMRGGSRARSPLYNLLEALQFASRQLPKLLALLSRESAGSRHGARATAEQAAVLQVQLIEPDGSASRPERLVEVLQGVEMLYGACATMLGYP
jgi:hypothetical protein